MDVFIKALANRIRLNQMMLEQVPEVYREEVAEAIQRDLSTLGERRGDVK